mgnify:CR=1 FL=1
MVCEKCWEDAGSNYQSYVMLLEERTDHPCTEQEQAGEYWDPVENKDRRVKNG